MKKKAMLMWILFVVCVLGTVGLRYLSDREDVEYEEVTVTVLSAQERVIENRKTNSSITSYDIKNAYNVYQYHIGNEVTAYLSRGSMFANIEGVQSSTPLFYAYFAFLVASFVMLGVAINESVKAKRK